MAGMFYRFKLKQHYRRTAETLEALADNMPTIVLRAAFPNRDPLDTMNSFLKAAAIIRKIRETV